MSEQREFATSTGHRIYRDELEAVQVASAAYPLQLLQDIALLDDVRHFSRERIPERILHAKGAGAHGYFKATRDLSEYTLAQPFQAANLNKEIEVTARFSTVEGQAGSADTVRTFRGFAVKLKTDVGNWDWVYIGFPVFSIRDPAKLIGLAHAQGRDPRNHYFNPDRGYDNFSSNPETVHQLLYTLSDSGIVDGYSSMNGYSVNPFSWINKDGVVHYVKMQLKSPDPKYLDSETGAKIAGTDPDYNSRLLYDSIHDGKYPSWAVEIQVMTLEQAKSFRYSPFDATKLWPEKEFPPIHIGELVLNRNPRNFFAEIEQLAFAPATLIPGITPSPDPILQTRLIFYPDTQCYRLGVNFQQLPTNKPRCPIFNFQRDGFMTIDNQPGYPDYNSSEVQSLVPPDPYPANDPQFNAQVVSYKSKLSPRDFEQPREFWRSLDQGQQSRLVANAVAALKAVRTKKIVYAQLAVYYAVDRDLGIRVARGLGLSDDDIQNIKPLFA